eukprot:Gb_15788 [translate_table: standard]
MFPTVPLRHGIPPGVRVPLCHGPATPQSHVAHGPAQNLPCLLCSAPSPRHITVAQRFNLDAISCSGFAWCIPDLSHMIEEVALHEEPKACPQPSPKIGTLACSNQVPVLPLLDHLNKMLSQEWPESILDGHIRLNYEDCWKVFEKGLDKKDYELFNHEQWHPTFMANVIEVLVRDLVQKIKDPTQGELSETKKAKEQSFKAEKTIKFAAKFCTIWLSYMIAEDAKYRQFRWNYMTKILEGLEFIITKLGAWILKCNYDQKEIGRSNKGNKEGNEGRKHC